MKAWAEGRDSQVDRGANSGASVAGVQMSASEHKAVGLSGAWIFTKASIYTLMPVSVGERERREEYRSARELRCRTYQRETVQYTSSSNDRI